MQRSRIFRRLSQILISEDTAFAVSDQPTSPPSVRRDPRSHDPGNGLWSVVVTQFQDAFNDNAYKNLVVFLILGTGLAKATAIGSSWSLVEAQFHPFCSR